MKPKFIAVQTIYEAADWQAGHEFFSTSMRERVATKADEAGLAIIGHEEFEYVWMKATEEPDGSIIYRAAPEAAATHVRVTYQRQAVSRQVRL